MSTTTRAPLTRVSVRRMPRLFATPADAPRARRATDAILAVAAASGLVLISVAAVPQPGYSRRLETLLRATPDLLDGFWQIVVDLLALLAVVLVVGAFVARRVTLARDLLVAAALALAVWFVVGRWVTGAWPDAWDALRSAEPPPWYPSPRIAVTGAVVVAAAPHLARPLRRVGRWLLTLALLGVVALGASSPLGAVAGVLVGAFAAAVVHLVFGSSAGRPGLDDVRIGLAAIGVTTRRVGVADRQEAGLFRVDAEDENGDPLVVKVYGRDAHDSALVTTVWRTLWYREPGSPIRIGRLQQVEHEAFLTLLAAQSGVRTDVVVTAGATPEDDALLVLRPLGRPLADLLDEAGEASAVDGVALVRQVWAVVRALRRAGLAHGQIDTRHLVPAGDEVGLRDFRGATVAATDAQEYTDHVQALATTVLLAGTDEAVRAARNELGAEGLTAALPYLQPTALTVYQRQRLREEDVDLDDVRRAAAASVGTEPPELLQLRRITLGSIVRVVLPAIAVVALISGIAGLDLERLLDALRDATWWLVVAAFVLGQVPRFTQAVATLGAAPVPLGLGPVYALQLAVSYVNLAIPSAAGRIAVNIRFFQRHGVPPGSALAVGALDGFASFVMQAILLASLLLFTPASLDVRLDRGTATTAARLLGLVVAAALIALVVLFAVRRWRTFVLRWSRQILGEAANAVRGLNSPRRAGLLVGGSLATELLFALTLGAFVRALGFSVGFGELLLINISVSLLSGLLPVPGGIGVTEGGLTLGLVRAGVPEEAAFAAVLLYRLATFYLPPIWGFFALRWLERNKHL
ncbi:MAG TPA: lysylphosphatidylglycerol synthase transmembrane domain-containing protein [Acidimicrobiales bacterium]|nr:lysylphosphatidylglycerol synthase transmembrane domain-containing protein [Acidimicrobiales bacterium]